MNTTTTHFAVLGLLAVRDWSTYDLVQYMQSSYLRYYWSKAESRLYETPKELVGLGYATATKERISDRADAKGRERTIYAITDTGRHALKTWLTITPQPPSLEVEALVKLAFADQGTLEQFLAQIQSLRAEVIDGARHDIVSAAGDEPQLPSRVHVSSHMADLLDRVIVTFLEWLDDLETDALTWDTVTSTPEHIENGKARYRALSQRMAATRHEPGHG